MLVFIFIFMESQLHVDYIGWINWMDGHEGGLLGMTTLK